jgi:hypothetical protein
MGEKRSAYDVLMEKLEAKRPLGSSIIRRDSVNETDLVLWAEFIRLRAETETGN